MKKLDVKNGTLSYHLHKLEKMEMIKSRREGLKYRAFYPTDMKLPQEERFRLTELQLDILKAVKANDGITQRKIAKILNRNPQTINYNVKVLRQAELIKLRRKGRRTVCYTS
jgi:predicted transcriptional regulator